MITPTMERLSFQSLTQQAETYRQMGHYEKAVYYLERARFLKPDSPWVNAHFGATWCQLGLHEVADICLEAATSQKPNYAWAWAQRGENYRTMRSTTGEHYYIESMACFDKAIELNPNYAWAWAHRGSVRHKLADFEVETEKRVEILEETRNDFLQSVSINPDYAWGWACLGIAEVMLTREHREHGASVLEMERTLKAFASVMTAVSLDHQIYGDNPVEVGMLLSYLREYEQAIGCYNQSLCQDRTNYTVLYNLAASMARLRGVAAAMPEINTARAALELALVSTQDEHTHKVNVQTFIDTLKLAGDGVAAIIESVELASMDARRSEKESGILYRLAGLAHLEDKEVETSDYLAQAIDLDPHILYTIQARYDVVWPEEWGTDTMRKLLELS